MKPIFQGNKKHPLDKDMPCPKCSTLASPSHYDDGEPDSYGNTTLFTPMWLCGDCQKIWDVEDFSTCPPAKTPWKKEYQGKIMEWGFGNTKELLKFDEIVFGSSFVEIINKDGNTVSVDRVHPLKIENPYLNRMDIGASPGTKVIFDSLGGYPGDKEFAKKYLVLDNTYTVLFVDIGNFSSEVYLKEFPNIPFNTVLFKAINEEELYKV